MDNSNDVERPLLIDDDYETNLQEDAGDGDLPTLPWLSDRRGDDAPQEYSQAAPRPRPPYIKRPVRKPAERTRRTAWIVIDNEAKRSFLHADKRAVVHNLGLHIPLRDMRLLDYNLLASESGKILVRDNAIIFSVEYIRLIITAEKALVPREATEHSPLSDRFVDVLEDAVHDWARQIAADAALAGQNNNNTASGTLPMTTSFTTAGGVSGGSSAVAAPGQHFLSKPSPSKPSSHLEHPIAATDTDDETSASVRHEYQSLPFELVVLEAALKEVVASSAAAVKELEGVAHPALDALTKSVHSANLERVRKVKTRHQRLIIRCEALREELQRFLGDDDDMTRMCLTRKIEVEEASKLAAQQAAQQESLHAEQQQASSQQQWGAQLQGRQPSLHVGSFRSRSGFLSRRSIDIGAHSAAIAMNPGSPRGSGGVGLLSGGVGVSGGRDAQYYANAAAAALDEEEADAEALQDVENLLESYYMQVDSQYDKLVSIGEYIKDTEEYINIELDSSRNRLIRLEIILTAATFAIAPFNLLAGILGENLVIPEQLTRSVKGFYGLNAVAFACCFMFFYSIMLYMRYRKLL